MVKSWLLAAVVLSLPLLGAAQKVAVLKQVPSETIHASASSQFERFPASLATDGSGMTTTYHAANNQGEGMWLSEVSRTPVRANAATREGAAWIMCSFDEVQKGISTIQIWNQNQNQHTRRGFRKAYIEYSLDGTRWETLKNGTLDYFTIPEAMGRKEEPASITIATGGISFKCICITADLKNGNHYHDGNQETMRQAMAARQNPNYYGLSEIRFYRTEMVAADKLPQIAQSYIIPSQGYLKTNQGAAREFTMRLSSPLYAGGKFSIEIGGKTKSITIPASAEGITKIDGTFPAGYMEEPAVATVSLASRQGNTFTKQEIPAARRWTLYFLPHSHLDIGYTHRQMDVMRLQWRNLELAMELAEQTRNNPEGSRYKWNAEATWCVQGYLDANKGTAKAQKLIDAIARGDIGMDATLGSILTGISKQEEMMHYFDDAHKIAAATGTEINTAMMSDVPGQSWGLVTAMAQNGVKYFSSGPNYVPTLGRLGSYGVGLYNLILGDVPFWWESQSGKEKVLYWQTGKGYSMFHGWLMDKLSVCGTTPIWDYLGELEAKQYPYPLSYLRYTIHGDNGPPDELMPEVIKAWNEKYEYPKFIIGTTKELFTEMETLYGDYLPTYAGDMTPVWEDGAASTARELTANRASAERLNQTEILWSMLRPGQPFPTEEMNLAWKHTILFSEHTWGAAGSGPEPESQFTKDLWEGKKMYADSAELLSNQLFDRTISAMRSDKGEYIQVVNTALEPRSDVVRVTGIDLRGKLLRPADGSFVEVQKLSDGSWIFYAQQIPGLSSASYQIVPDIFNRYLSPQSMASGNTLDNGRIKVMIDPATGNISSFANGRHDYAGKGGLNGYLYSGRNFDSAQGAGEITSIEIIDDGPVAATIRVISQAAGCRSLTRDVTIYRGTDRVDIVNTLDKLNEYQHENVRFAFPLNIFNPEVSIDLAMSEMHPEREQIISSNKNFYSILNGLSVANINQGVYLTSLDAPFIELGTPTADLARQAPRATGWLNAATVSATVYSWAMNNRWRTNYKASQEGLATFRYSLEPFSPEMGTDMKRKTAAQAQPLVAIPSTQAAAIAPLMRTTGNNRIAISTIRPTADGYIIRLQNSSPQSVHSSIEWGSLKPVATNICDEQGNPIEKFDAASFWMKPYDCITFKATTK